MRHRASSAVEVAIQSVMPLPVQLGTDIPSPYPLPPCPCPCIPLHPSTNSCRGYTAIRSYAFKTGSRWRQSCHQPKECGCSNRQFRTPPVKPAVHGRESNNIGRTFSCIKSSHASVRRHRDHMFQDHRALDFPARERRPVSMKSSHVRRRSESSAEGVD